MAGLPGHALFLGQEIGHDHLGHAAHNAGDNAAQEELAGGQAADAGDDHHGDGGRDDFSFGPVLKGLWESWPALLMPIIIVGTIMSGIVSPTENRTRSSGPRRT